MPEKLSQNSPKPINRLDKNNRVNVGLLIGLVVVSLLLMGGWAWVTFVSIMVYVGFKEFCLILEHKQIYPSRIMVLGSAVIFILLASQDLTHLFAPAITIVVIGTLIRMLFRQRIGTISDIGATLLGVFYLAYLPVHFILLRDLGAAHEWNPLRQDGLGYIFLTVLVIASSDIAAYYGGKYFGKNLLYERISPKKTKEGAFWGLVGGIFAGLVFSYFIRFPLAHAVILSLLLVIAGQLGDLCESLIKRDAGVKDSGTFLLGHGGILDRLDSYIFSGAVSYYYIHWVILKEGFFKDIMLWLAQSPQA
jgi:phosphatidate cytidylyltransferase